MSDWRTAKVEDITEKVAMGPFGSSIKVETFVSEGVPIISGGHLRGTRLQDGRFNFISEDHARRLANSNVYPGDVVFTHAGNIGQVSYIPEDARYSRYVLSQRQFYLRPDKRQLIPAYVAYYFRTAAGRQQLLANASSTGVPAIAQPVTYLRQLTLPLPPIAEQRAIVEMLASLDDKIENNARIAEAAPALAVTLLQDASLHAPRVRLGDVAEVRKGLSYKGSGLADAGMPMVNLANAARFGGFKREGFKHYNGDYKPRHVARGGELLVANTDLTWKLDALGWPMLVPDDVETALFSQDVSIIDFAAGHKHLRLPTWAHLFTHEARSRVEAMAYGTTVARFPPDALTGLEVPVLDPASPGLAATHALLRRAWAAERESMALARLRDALLPPLMSGELRVPAVGGAAATTKP
jgi:hypothetical protein